MRLRIKITSLENKENATSSSVIKPRHLSIKDRVKIFSTPRNNIPQKNEYNTAGEAPKKININPNLINPDGSVKLIQAKNEESEVKEDLQKYLYGIEKKEENKKDNTKDKSMEESSQIGVNNNFLSSKASKKEKQQKKNSELQSVLMSLKNPKSKYEQELKKGKIPVKVKNKNKIPIGDSKKGIFNMMLEAVSPKPQKILVPPAEAIENENQNQKKEEIKEKKVVKDKKKMFNRYLSSDTRKLKVKNNLADEFNLKDIGTPFADELFGIKSEYYKKEYLPVDSIKYSEFLKKLKEKKTIERETFCEGFFVASFPTKNGEVIEDSESFPSSCGHKECSTFPSMKPEIIYRYPLEDTKNLELNNLAATICFPTGIKVCYSEEAPTNMIDDYLTSITNAKGERYYMMTYHFYQQVNYNEFQNISGTHPLKHYLKTFGESYMTLNEECFTDKIMKKVQDNLALCQEIGFRDYVYIPFCLCLISKYPYAYEMTNCLQSIFNVISEEEVIKLSKTNFKINDLIMYLINSVPIPIEKNSNVKFYIPFLEKGIYLQCPKLDEINIVNINYLQLIELFSIDNFIIIIRLLLFEKKILFIDDDYTRLSEVTDAFISLLYPFKWIHTYIPIMSDQMLKYLESFLPFLSGIHSSLMPLVSETFINSEVDDNEDVFLIYIKDDKIDLSSTLKKKKKKLSKYISQINLPNLPINSEKKLRNKLSDIKDSLSHNNNSKLSIGMGIRRNSKVKRPVDPSESDKNIRNAFIEMFVDMFREYPKYMCILDNDVVFNKNSFLNSVHKSDKTFFDEFIDTQLFQQFTQTIFSDECEYFNKVISPENTKNDLMKSIDIKTINVYVCPPQYLDTKEKEDEPIQKFVSLYYPVNLESNFIAKSKYKDANGIIAPSHRIVPYAPDILGEDYKNDNCLIYLLPNQKFVSTQRNLLRDSSVKILDSIKNKNVEPGDFQPLKKTFTGINLEDLNEKNKDEIKETIKDYLRKIFQSENIDYKDPKIKTEILNMLKTSYGREFFVNSLSSNLKNIVLLQPNSYKFLGFLIYNVLVSSLQMAETEKLLEEVYLLIKSSMYFGVELKGKTQTLFHYIKSKLRDYPKIIQNNFWYIWFENEIKAKKDEGDSTKQLIILDICSKMVQIEISKTTIKNLLDYLNTKAFGENSEMGAHTQKMYIRKITEAKYLSKAKL